MIKILDYLGRHAPLFLAVGVFMGILMPQMDKVADFVITPLVVMMLTASMVRVDMKEVIAHLRRPFRLLLVLAFIMIALPIVVILLVGTLPIAPHLFLAVILVVCAPPLASSPGLVAFLKMDTELALSVMILATLVSPVTAPLVLEVMSIEAVTLDSTALFLRMAGLIGLSVAVAFVIRRIVGHAKLREHLNVIDGTSALLMIAFAFLVLNRVTFDELTNLPLVMETGLISVGTNWSLHVSLLCLFLVALGLLGSKNSRSVKVIGSVAILASNRNLALFIAILPPQDAAQIFLFLAFTQLPIYLTPLIAQPLYKRVLRWGETTP